MKYDEFIQGAIAGTAVTLFAWSVLQATLFTPDARQQFEREAVQHGAATWTVDEDGNRVFKWRESK